MSLPRDIVEGALMALGATFVIRAVADALAVRRKRRLDRIIAEAEEQARADIEAAVKKVADEFRANIVAAQADFDKQRQTCTCEDCVRWRQWAAGRNN